MCNVISMGRLSVPHADDVHVILINLLAIVNWITVEFGAN